MPLLKSFLILSVVVALGATACTSQGNAAPPVKPTPKQAVVKARDKAPVVKAKKQKASSQGRQMTPTMPSQIMRGATVPWTEYEAEAGETNGTTLEPSRIVGTAAAECSGRSGVTLSETGQYVQWKTTKRANALVVRLSIPDAPEGNGIGSTLNLYVNGAFRRAISVSSRLSWLYGEEDHPTNTPGGTSRFMFDESSLLIGDVPAGATVQLRKDAANTADYYTIDLVDMEQVPAPLTMPPNFLSITDSGATPDDGTDDIGAMESAYKEAKKQGKGLWIPPGTFTQSHVLTVEDMAVRGAGMWYSKFQTAPYHKVPDSNDTAGFWVINNCQFSDFAILGRLTDRGAFKNVSAFRGTFGTGSRIENIWGEHTECFAWLGVDSFPILADGVVLRNNRIRNTLADGINFASGTKNSRMENNHARNTGDDGFAIYSSPRKNDPEPSHNNTIVHCTSQMPWRASGIAIYGGYGNTVEECAVYDTLTYPGMAVHRGANSRPYGPEATTLRNVDLVRCGGTFWRGQEFGALWAVTDTGTIENGNILFQNVNITDASYSGIHLQSAHGYGLSGITFDNVHVRGAGTYSMLVREHAIGSATFRNVTVAGAKQGGFKNGSPDTFTVKREQGNTGW